MQRFTDQNLTLCFSLVLCFSIILCAPLAAQEVTAQEITTQKTAPTSRDLHFVPLVDKANPKLSLLISETEITQHQWSRLTGTNPAFFPGCGGDCPIEGVSWNEAVTFANRLSQKEGRTACYKTRCEGVLGGGCEAGGHGVSCYGDYLCQVKRVDGCTGYRLPTSEEWEYAARAGTTAATYNGDLTISPVDGTAPELEPIGWYSGNSRVDYGGWNCSHWASKGRASDRCGPHPVAAKRANSFGLYDLLGNVWEWVDDASGRGAGIRGGAWNVGAIGCRAESGDVLSREYRSNSVGFRLVRLNTDS